MEVKFMKNALQCLRPFYSQVHKQEQTQEVRLPDAYPDIGKVLGVWGQVLMRGKEWRSASLGANGGVMAWVMYAPEDGTQYRVMETWIPIQCRWDLQDPADDGVMILRPMLTSLDARSISARKIMLRCGVDTFVQAMGKWKAELAQPPELPEDVQVLSRNYPVELPMEAGEKQVQMEESLPFGNNLPPIGKIASYNMTPEIAEHKILGNRLVFRGQVGVHMRYMTEEGTLCQWDADVPFSQFAELDRDYGTNAGAWMVPVLTAMEMEISEEQGISVRAGIAAQYTVFDQIGVDVVEDVYSPVRDINVKMEEMELPILLDTAKVEVEAENVLEGEFDRVLSVSAFSEYPVLSLGEDGMQIRMDGQHHALCLDVQGQMTGTHGSFHSTDVLSSAPENQVQLWPAEPVQSEIVPGADAVTLRTRYPITAQVFSGQTIPAVTELTLSECREPDPDRPSIVLRRAEEESLWAIAKDCGTTVAAIRKANQLSGEPEKGQMLLIPIP